MAIYREGVTHYAAAAGTDLTGKLYCFAIIDSNGNIALSGAAGNVIGVVMEEATVGNAATVQVDGIAKVKTGGNIAAGSRVESDANGLARSAQSSNAVVGIALTAATSGDVIPVRMF